MKLKYQILWFENEPTWFEPNKVPIENYLLKKGFQLDVVNLKGDENWENLVNLEEFDLIIVDLKLKNQEMGDKLIQKIRDKDVFTEIIFYSQDGESKVREIISNEGIDGVYCSGRESDDFEKTTIKVIETTIKKIQDLNNLRGLVMAEVSNLDVLLFRTIEKYHNGLDPEGIRELLKKIKEKIINRLDEKKKKISRFNGLDDFGKNPHYLETYSRWTLIKGILNEKNNPSNNLTGVITIFNSFDEEIAKLRNKLAHIEETSEDGKIVLKTPNSDEAFIFNHEKCDEVRGNLIKHRENIEKIYSLL